MKKIILISSILLVSIIGFAQNEQIRQETAKINDVLYVVENGVKYKVDTKRLIVKPKSTTKLIDPSVKVLYKHNLGYIDIEVPEGVDIEKYVTKLKQSKQYETVEYITEVKTYLSYNDPYPNSNAYYRWYIDRMNLNDAWDITTGSPTVKVAVLDTGIDRDHPDLGYDTSIANNNYTNVSYTLGYDYYNNGVYQTPYDPHGTIVAGVIGAKTNNGIGVVGVSGGNHSSGVTIIPYRVLYADGMSTSYIGDGIIKAVNDGADVITLCLGPSMNSSIYDAITYASNHGVSIVCATGNDDLSQITPLAADSRTIAVGCIDNQNARWSDFYFENNNIVYVGSNYGDGLELVAPGCGVYSTVLQSGYDIRIGTSIAAPLVSGTIALMLSVNPSLTSSDIRKILRNTAIKLPNYHQNGANWNSEVGYGVVNAFAAVCNAYYHITGPDFICNTGTYSIEGIPSGFTAVWSVPTGLSITSGQGTSTITVQRQNNTSNIGDIVVQFYKNGESKCTLRKDNIVVGTPDLGMSVILEASNGDNGYWTSNSTAANNTFTIEEDMSWAYDRVEGELYKMDNNFNPSQLVASWNNISTQGASIPGYAEGWYLFQLRGENDCGYSDWLTQEVEVIDISNRYFSIDYDPAAEVLTITLNDPQFTTGPNNGQSKNPSGVYEIQLWNSLKTTMMRNYKTDLATFPISLAGLPKGIYLVRIIKDGKSYSRKFVR